MPKLALYAQVGAEERGGEFRDKFLGGVGASAEAS
jgi:hypothetical protein